MEQVEKKDPLNLQQYDKNAGGKANTKKMY
jgi:hypothetical protein